MNSEPPNFCCNAKAVEVAWKLRWHRYDSEDAAVRALRRRCRGISSVEASSALHVAAAVLERAIRVLKPHLKTLGNIYQTRVEIGLDDVAQFEPELAAHFPNCPSDALRTALQTAMVYHMR